MKEFFERVPAIFIRRLESVEIDGDDTGFVLCHQSVHCFCEFRFFRRGRKILNGPVLVVSDAKQIEEIAKESGVCADEPDLQKVRGNIGVLLAPEPFANPGRALELGFPLNENRADVALLAERGDGPVKQVWLLFCEVSKELRRHIGRHFGEDFVRFIHRGARTVGGGARLASPRNVKLALRELGKLIVRPFS